MGKSGKRKQKIGAGIKVTAAILLVVAAGFMWWQYRTPPKPQGEQAFFSDDDGTTWFADDYTRIAPFDHNGKQAVRAKVYETASGKQFVGYLMKFTDKAHDDAVYSQKTHQMRPGPSVTHGTVENTLLVKRPHDKDWVPDMDPRANEIKAIKCPDGSTDYTLVRP